MVEEEFSSGRDVDPLSNIDKNLEIQKFSPPAVVIVFIPFHFNVTIIVAANLILRIIVGWANYA